MNRKNRKKYDTNDDQFIKFLTWYDPVIKGYNAIRFDNVKKA